MDPAPDPDPTPFLIDLKDAKIFFFSYNLTPSKNFYFFLKICVKILFCRHYFSPLDTSTHLKEKGRIREARKHADPASPTLQYLVFSKKQKNPSTAG
jgi:hypothetical protein